MISVRADAPKDLEHRKVTIRILMEAIGEEVKVKMQYYSVHSQQKKAYTIHPYRLMYFRGGLYLFAFVEEYSRFARSPSSASRASRRRMTRSRSRTDFTGGDLS